MARIRIAAFAMNAIETELRAEGVRVTALDPPWVYLLEGPRAALESALLKHWGYGAPGLADEWPDVRARIECGPPIDWSAPPIHGDD